MRRDCGLTLVELLVVVAISGVIMPILVGTLVIGWKTTDDTVQRLSDTRNRNLTPSLFTRDVQSARTVTTTGSTCTSTGDTLLVRLAWTETGTTGSVVSRAASWVLTPGTDNQLQRRYCPDGTTVDSTVTSAHGVVGTPAVSCLSATNATVACASAVRVDLAVTDTTGSFTATGRRRSA